MFSFISSNLPTIIVGAIVCGVVALVVIKMLKDKKNKVSSCGCGCSSCSASSFCHSSSDE